MGSGSISERLNELLAVLNRVDLKQKYKFTIGFDGFVDEIIEVVDQRASCSHYTKIPTIGQFGARISRSANLSTNIELVPRVIKLGGNGPIMANALCATEQRVAYMGALGYPQIHPVFEDLVNKCEHVLSFAEPAHTDALEFTDGKIMLGKLTSLEGITWDSLVSAAGEVKLKTLFTEADLVATVNWTMIPNMNQLWLQLSEFLRLHPPQGKPYFFVDLADPEKRSLTDKSQALELILGFQQYYKVILGLNRKEASELATVLQLDLSNSPEKVSMIEIATGLANKLDLWCLVIHSVDQAVAVREGETVIVPGPYTANPVLTTGAGDNFNAGFCLGLLMDLSLENILLLAKAASGFYVRNGYSPSFDELKEFISLWAKF